MVPTHLLPPPTVPKGNSSPPVPSLSPALSSIPSVKDTPPPVYIAPQSGKATIPREIVPHPSAAHTITANQTTTSRANATIPTASAISGHSGAREQYPQKSQPRIQSQSKDQIKVKVELNPNQKFIEYDKYSG